MITKFQIEHWGQKSNVKVCRPKRTPFRTRTDISARLPKSPGMFPSFAGSKTQKQQLKKQIVPGYTTYEGLFYIFSNFEKYFPGPMCKKKRR